MPSISMKELLEAGVHFGHQTKRWNPKMKEYIFGERNGIYIIDLQKTLKLFKDAMRYVAEAAAQGKTVLFVGTKRQAQEAVAEEATALQPVLCQPALVGWIAYQHADRSEIHQASQGTGRLWPTMALRGPGQERSRPPGARAQTSATESGGHQGNERPSRCTVRGGFEQGSHRRKGSPQAGHSRCRGGGHQLRSR